jgi:hypothetical protein
MSRLVLLAALALAACGPDFAPAPPVADGGCELECVSVQPPGRGPPRCNAEGVCVCYEWACRGDTAAVEQR